MSRIPAVMTRSVSFHDVGISCRCGRSRLAPGASPFLLDEELQLVERLGGSALVSSAVRWIARRRSESSRLCHKDDDADHALTDMPASSSRSLRIARTRQSVPTPDRLNDQRPGSCASGRQDRPFERQMTLECLVRAGAVIFTCAPESWTRPKRSRHKSCDEFSCCAIPIVGCRSPSATSRTSAAAIWPRLSLGSR